MKLTFKDSRGQNHQELEAVPAESILQLKIRLYKQTGFIYVINLNAIELEDSQTLQDYGIDKDSTLTFCPATEQVKIPQELLCELSGQIFLDPVSLPSGAIVERQVIEKWILKNRSCPFSKDALSLEQLIPDTGKKTQVEQLMEQQKDNPFIKATQYTLEEIIPPSQATVYPIPARRDADDILAMGLTPSTFSQANPHGFFLPPFERLFSYWEREALKDLQNHGLMAHMLLDRKDNRPGHQFDFHHRYALVSLVKARQFSIQAALDEIAGLSEKQAMGIKEGLNRQDVMNLNNFWHISVLAELKSVGLTTDMLLHRQDNGHQFDEDHHHALVRLVKNRQFSIQAALDEIAGLSKEQAMGIEKGLNRQDVINLDNFYHILALTKLKSKGLTADMLLHRQDNGHRFDDHHHSALVRLVKDRHFLIQAALDEIAGLSEKQAMGIKEGLNRQDVINLDNYYHISALTKLKSKGLTANMLLHRQDNGHRFDDHHHSALVRLVKDRQFSIQAALDEIAGLSENQAMGIKEGLNRQDVINLDNYYHISALAKLKSKGLTADMLLHRQGNGHRFDDHHHSALVMLVKNRQFSIQAALDEIAGLSSSQARGITEGLSREEVLEGSGQSLENSTFRM